MIIGAFDIKHMPHTSVKGQVLADLVSEFTEYPMGIGVEGHRLEGQQVSIISLKMPHPRSYTLMEQQIKRDLGWGW